MEQPGGSGQHPSTLRNVLIWTYERGTLQYDILCGLILAFIFLVPRSCFAPKKPPDAAAAKAAQVSTTGASSQRSVPDEPHPNH